MVMSSVGPPRRRAIAGVFGLILLTGCCAAQPYAFQLLVPPTTGGVIASGLPYAFWRNWSGKVIVIPARVAGRTELVLLGKELWSVFASLEACVNARDEGVNDLVARSLKSESNDLKKSAAALFKRARHSRSCLCGRKANRS